MEKHSVDVVVVNFLIAEISTIEICYSRSETSMGESYLSIIFHFSFTHHELFKININIVIRQNPDTSKLRKH